MAIEYILSGDTNNTGRLKINATWDEIITGTTLSVNNGEYILEQFDGSQITGQVKLPSNQTNSSQLVQIGDDAYTSNTIYITAGNYVLDGNDINISNLSSVSLQANVTSVDRLDSIYIADDGFVNVVQGTGSTVPLTPDFSSGGTEWAYVGSVLVAANAGGYFIANQGLEESNDVGTATPEFFGSLSSTLLGGWIPKSTTTGIGGGTVITSTIGNSFAFGNQNKVWDSNSSIFGGIANEISGNSTFSNIAGGVLNKIKANANYASIIGGTLNSISGNADASIVLGGQNNIIVDESNDSGILAGRFNSIGDNADWTGIVAGSDNTISGASSFSTIIGGNDNYIRNSSGATIIGSSGATLNVASNRTVINYDGFTDGASYKLRSVIVPHLHIDKSLIYHTTVTAVDYTATTEDYMIVTNQTSGITITLEGVVKDGRTLVIKDGRGTASTNNITIDGDINFIDGSTTQVLNSDYESMTVTYSVNLNKWFIV